MKKIGYILVLLGLFMAAGCASQVAATSTETMMASTTPDTMMATATPDQMMASASPDTMMASATPDTMMQTETPGGMMASDVLLSTSFTDTASGNTFKLSDFNGKVVLVELISTQCAACLEQQKSIQAYLSGAGKNVVVISLDVVSSETAADLQAHLGMTTFKWSYAKAPADLVTDLGTQFGSQYIDPTNTPLFVIDQMGEVHSLALNLTSTSEISNAVASYVSGM